MISKKDTGTTKERLLKTGLKLFSEMGFDATTTRMISKETGVSLSSISFHFETKEALYKAVIDQAVNILDQYLSPFFTEINDLFDKGLINSDNAWDYIYQLLKLQINWYFNDEYSTVVKLIIREHNFSNNNDNYFFNVLYTKAVAILTRLIMTASGNKNYEDVMLYSLSLNGTIQALGEHKAFLNKAFDINNDPVKYENFMKKITEFTLKNAKLYITNENT